MDCKVCGLLRGIITGLTVNGRVDGEKEFHIREVRGQVKIFAGCSLGNKISNKC